MQARTKMALAAGLTVTALAGLGNGVAQARDNHGGSNGRRNPDCQIARDPGRHKDLEVVGLTADSRLICFREDRPARAADLATITGLGGDTSLVGIDYRPVDRDLIGLGNAGGVYSLNITTGVATKKSQLNVALAGTSFGIDFNPTVDRLRIVSDSGQSLRANVDTGATTVDSALTYTAPPAAPVTATGIVGAAYTNNDADPNTATTLYDIDASLDQVAIQAPPNAGILNPTGKLGVDTGPVVGSDIYSTIRNGTTVDVQGFASLTVGGQSGFYKVTLATGKATARGTFASRNQVVGIAIPLNQL